MNPAPARRRLLLLALTALAGALMAALAGLLSAPAGADTPSESLAVPLDRQDYVADQTASNPQGGPPQDAYNDDPSSIHVGVDGGREFARSFIHLALDYLPQGTQAISATATFALTQQSDASNAGIYPLYQVNGSSAAITACVLTSELPSQFDPNQPPAYDCSAGSSKGSPSADGSKWSFDLTPLLAYWRSHGNTGAALVPSASALEGTATWQVAFYKSRSASVVRYGPAPVPGSTQPSAVAPSSSSPQSASGAANPSPNPSPEAPLPQSSGAPTDLTGQVPAGQNPAIAAPTAQPVASSVPGASGSAGPAPATGPATANVPTPTAALSQPVIRHIRIGGSPVWPWVLLICLAVAAVAVGLAHRQTLIRAIPRSGAIWRAHPRAYAVAAASLVWGMVFGAYSAGTSGGRTLTFATPAPGGVSALAGPAGSTSASSPGGLSLAGGTNSSIPTGGSPTNAQGSPNGGPAAATGAVGAAGAAGAAGGSTAASASPGSAGTSAGSSPGASEASSAGTTRDINGIPVFFPARGTPEARLFTGADNTQGIDARSIRICAHAALTYGSAFHISASDLDVYWEKVNAGGGINGRRIVTSYQNDNYDPGTAVQAAQACKDWGTFYLVGGIGFDQIPAVRQWAEQNHMPYLHHIATIEGTAGLRYSFSALPTVEQFGQYMGEVAARQFAGKKVGIIYRQSSNWTPGVDAFTKTVQAAGMKIVGSYGVQINQGNYVQEVTQLHSAGAQVVLSWENALAEIEMIKQAQAQGWHPAWLVNPFNIITNTLGSSALDQDLWGAAAWDAYDPGYYGGGFASYADQIHEFEAEYKQFDPGADLSGDGGDLLFLNWEAEKYEGALLTACGSDCTRNKFVGLLLAGFSETVPPNCPADFNHTGDHHHGGYTFNVMHAVADPNGRANFVPVARCVASY